MERRAESLEQSILRRCYGKGSFLWFSREQNSTILIHIGGICICPFKSVLACLDIEHNDYEKQSHWKLGSELLISDYDHIISEKAINVEKMLLENLWPAWVDFRRAFLMSSSVLLLSLISSCCVFTSRSFCLSARALRAYSHIIDTGTRQTSIYRLQ